MHFARRVNGIVSSNGLRIERRTTVGYGPFTVRGRALMNEDRSRRVHYSLDALARGRLPFLRRMGWHYLVLARRVQGGAPDTGPGGKA